MKKWFVYENNEKTRAAILDKFIRLQKTEIKQIIFEVNKVCFVGGTPKIINDFLSKIYGIKKIFI